MRTSFLARVLLFSLIIVLGVWPLAGCEQPNDQRVAQTPNQTAPTTSDQDQATQGSSVNIAQHNMNGGGGPENRGTTTQPSYDAEQVAVGGPAGSLGLAKARGDTWNIQYNYVQTGGTTPSLTGYAAGTATQTPSQVGTQSPTQTVTPETSASVPIGVAMPGGNVSNQATAATRGNADAVKQDQITQQYAEIRAQAERIKELTEIIKALQGKPVTTQPDVLPMTPVVPGTP